MMWLKILCVVVIASGALGEDELLEQLSGRSGGNRVWVCVGVGGAGVGGAGAGAAAGRARRCAGALLTRECVLARAGCLRTASSRALTIERPSAGGSCDQLPGGHSVYSSRKVRAHVMHPWFDLALLVAHTPYNNLDQLSNSTEIFATLKRTHNMYSWMEYYFTHVASERDQVVQMTKIARSLKTYHHPIWFFLTTIVLPSVLLMLFFIYVTFYTGSSQEIPYKRMHYPKKLTKV